MKRYSGILKFKNRLKGGYISTIKCGGYNTPEDVLNKLKFLVTQVEPMDGEYSMIITPAESEANNVQVR